jgi:hypothetical protein
VVTVEDEGIYGFKLIQNGVGTESKRPQTGERPDAWIGVDLTKPQARLLAAQQGVGADADKLVIAWEASDNQKLAARPITLAYSETRGGPWMPIAKGLENAGRYTWTLDARLPQRVFLRIEVQDEAGNMATSDTAEPVVLNRAAPPASPRDAGPVGRMNQRTSQW